MKRRPLKNKLIHKQDLILIGCLLLLVPVLFLMRQFFFQEEGRMVVVTVDGVLFGEYSLNQDRVISIPGTNGTNQLRINQGTAYMLQAECPDLICVSHQPVSHSGESIICLPNRIVVRITGETEDTVPDFISQ